MDAFSEYLNSKKIDEGAFKRQSPVEYNTWEQAFAQMHPASFTAQKLFLINGIRRQFPLQSSDKESVAEAPKKPMKPRVKIPVKKS